MKKCMLLLMVLLSSLLLGGCGSLQNPLTGKQLVFETTDLDGDPVRSEEIFGEHEITMLNLWAAWCGPCVAELSELNDVNEELAKMDGVVVGLLNDGRDVPDVEAAKRFLSENGVQYLNILAPADMDDLIRQSVYPMTVFVDRNGVVIGKPLYGTRAKGKIADYYLSAAREALDNAK